MSNLVYLLLFIINLYSNNIKLHLITFVIEKILYKKYIKFLLMDICNYNICNY